MTFTHRWRLSCPHCGSQGLHQLHRANPETAPAFECPGCRKHVTEPFDEKEGVRLSRDQIPVEALSSGKRTRKVTP